MFSKFYFWKFSHLITVSSFIFSKIDWVTLDKIRFREVRFRHIDVRIPLPPKRKETVNREKKNLDCMVNEELNYVSDVGDSTFSFRETRR